MVIYVVNITLNVSKELYNHMKKYPELKWDKVAKKSFLDKLRDLQLLEDLKVCEEAEKAFERGECIPFDEAIKQLGLEDDI